MSPRVTGLYKSEVRERIIQAAIESFARTGFDKTKMDDIAKRLDLSKGTLYLYFKSKEDLFYAICEYYLDALKKQFSFLVGEQESLPLAAERLYDNFRKLEGANDKVMLEMIVESTRNTKLRKILYEHRLRVAEVVTGYLKSQVENGSIRKEIDLNSLTAGYRALYDGLALARLLVSNEDEHKRAWVAMVKASFAGIS